MKIDVQLHGQVAVVTPRGALTRDCADPFIQGMKAPMEQRRGEVVIDCRDIPYLDSVGIETLLTVCGDRRSPTPRPRLAGLTDTCREALDLTNTLSRFEIFDSVESALRSYKR